MFFQISKEAGSVKESAFVRGAGRSPLTMDQVLMELAIKDVR
ncbi:MAG: hypothetical protein K0R57_425 [Paenibacillaceae bacterium]|jgi:hypothetical protein|nr:hypothetical protein [Paenibacillaceae bacterium]